MNSLRKNGVNSGHEKNSKSDPPENHILGQYCWNSKQNVWHSRWDNGKWKGEIMKFGKYKNQNLEDVFNDKTYCDWLKLNIKPYPGALSYMLFCVYKLVPAIPIECLI